MKFAERSAPAAAKPAEGETTVVNDAGRWIDSGRKEEEAVRTSSGITA
jgi:hypothetical protein